MKLRTQRRVTPQAKLRYRAIRAFLRRALVRDTNHNVLRGSLSQNTIQSESSVNSYVESFKSKDLKKDDRKALSNYDASSESQDRRINKNDQYSKSKLTLRESDHGRKPGTETEVLYQSTDNQFQKSGCSDDSQNSIDEGSFVATERLNLERQRTKPKKKKREKIETSSSYGSEYKRLHNYIYNTNSQRTNDRAQFISSHGHNNLTPRKRTRRVIKKEPKPEVETYQRKSKYDEQLKRNKSYSPGRCHRHTTKRNSKSKSNVDQEFIAEIIRRQYKPVKRFKTNESAISQFTVPECLDGPTYCTLNPSHRDRQQQQHHYTGHGDYCDMRSTDLGSICDTCLYSNKRRTRPTQQRKTEVYNDSLLYDVIPVKERPSSQIRRRHTKYDIIDDNLPYQEIYSKAVPPSPRSQRPQLNLRSQFNQEYENYEKHKQNRNMPSKKQRMKSNANVLKQFTGWENRAQEHAMEQLFIGCQDTSGPVEDRVLGRSEYTDYHKQTYGNESTNLNKTEENNTESALFEIKHLLKNFLDELKKDVSIRLSDQWTSNGVHAQTSNNIGVNNNNRIEGKHTNIEINSADISLEHPLDLSYATIKNHRCYNEQCSEPPPYVSTEKHCCYSVEPFPLHCTQPLHAACLCNPNLQGNTKNNKSDDTACRFNEDANDTDLLIKEIHKFVTQDSRMDRRESVCQLRQTKTGEVALMTARSAGSHVSKRDAKVGTPRLQCCSRSCEAIGTPATNSTQKATGSYSETNFERVIELTDLESDTLDIQQKGIRTNFSKVLQSFFKKKKSKIEEIDKLNESYTDNTVNTQRESGHRPRREFPPAEYPYLPYQTHSPPMPPHECREPYNCPRTRHPSHLQQRDYGHGRSRLRTYEPPYTRPRPSAPPYHPQHYPNPNLCLQEIEITSTATQSEKKLSFFQKLAKNKYLAKPKQDSTQSSSTQTTQRQKQAGLFNFNRIPQRPSEIAMFSHLDNHKMVMGDTKFRDAVLKKMMRKKNPFSSRNLLLNTILGKDTKPSFDPMSMIRSRMKQQ